MLSYAALLIAFLGASPVLPDHLEPVSSRFADFTANTPQGAFHRLLLQHPRRVLHMVTVPSFDLEDAVYVTASPQGRAPNDDLAGSAPERASQYTVHYAAFVGPGRRCDPKRLLPDGGGWSSTDVWAAEAPISPGLAKQLQQLWAVAVGGARVPEKRLTMKDGARHYFGVEEPGGMRFAQTTSQLDQSSKMSALIQLATRLGFLARCAPEDRPELERELASTAGALRERFLADGR